MIIVTGATGFVGFYLVNQLKKEGFDVLATDKSGTEEAKYFKKVGIPFVQMDITKTDEFDKLPKENIEAIINLACVQPANMKVEEYDPMKYINVNVVGMMNIMKYGYRYNAGKILHTISHRNVQGLWEAGEVINEESPRAIKYTGKFSMFSISESAAADIMEYFIQEHDVRGVLIRLPPVYGFGHHKNLYQDGKVSKTGFGVFIDNAIEGEPIEIWGDSEKGRDIIYVKDVVSAFIKTIKSKNAKGLYNIASGTKLNLKEQVDGIIKVFSKEKKSEVIFRPEKNNSVDSFMYDISKAKRELDWAPEYSYVDMLIDYKKEMEAGNLDFLLERKERMSQENR